MSDQRIDWLWQERIPRGALTVIASEPAMGRSVLFARMAADVTCAGHRVLYSNPEDPIAEVSRDCEPLGQTSGEWSCVPEYRCRPGWTNWSATFIATMLSSSCSTR